MIARVENDGESAGEALRVDAEVVDAGETRGEQVGLNASARLDALESELRAVYGTAMEEEGELMDDDGTVGESNGVVSVERLNDAMLARVTRGEETALASRDVETVQLIRCKFQMKKTINFGEELRLTGSHPKLGTWNMSKSLTLNWGEGDVWTSDDIELPVDGVFIYKYAIVPAGQPETVLSWQQGNNNVLMLSSDDLPRLWINDCWSGNPDKASLFREGGQSESKEDRLISRVKGADDAARAAEEQVKHLKEDLEAASMQVKALRQEARLAANVRLALKEQLRVEKQRSNVLSSQIDAWKNKFLSLGDGGRASSSEEEDVEEERGDQASGSTANETSNQPR